MLIAVPFAIFLSATGAAYDIYNGRKTPVVAGVTYTSTPKSSGGVLAAKDIKTATTSQTGSGSSAPTPIPVVTAPASPPKSAVSAAPAPKKTSPAPAPTPAAAGGEIAPESSCPGQKNINAAQSVIVCLSTYARAKYGAGALSSNSVLIASAAPKAQDIIDCSFSHTACGRAFDYWIKNKGYSGRCYAENIAKGQKNPLEVFSDWMNSPGHRANILKPDYRDMGIAALSGGGSINWVMHLGGC